MWYRMLQRKAIKLLRQLRWSLPSPKAAPVHWHVGRPNFGDDLNPVLFQYLLGRKVRLTRGTIRHRILGMGSILHKVDDHCDVVGSGLLDPAIDWSPSAKTVVSLRGELSAEASGLQPDHLGDPAIFLPHLYPLSKEKTHRYGFIPHHSEVKKVKRYIPKDWLFIDPSGNPLSVLQAIVACENIVSRSLHGLICADAYGVPNAWLHPLESMRGVCFKYHDYYSTMTEPKQPARIGDRELKQEVEFLDFFTSSYRYDLESYMNAIRHLGKKM